MKYMTTLGNPKVVFMFVLINYLSMKHGTMNWFKKVNLQFLKPIDFCFVTEETIAVDTYRVDNSYRIDRKPISDHFPIIVDFRILKDSH